MATQVLSAIALTLIAFIGWQVVRRYQDHQAIRRADERQRRIEQQDREDARLARRLPLVMTQHEQAMERERLRILNERHILDMHIAWEKHIVEKHLLLTQIPADAKGHYPYVVHPENGYQALPNVNMRQISQRGSVTEEEQDAAQAIPSLIEYASVKSLIPQGHALVGVGARGIETREDSIRALVWIVGGSGVGKTNSVSIRVDDDYERGHRFLGIDPHAFKVDSLTNALRAYQSCFLMPIAQKTEDITQVLDTFLGEFERRKNGGTWQHPITLVVDEVGSMVMDIDKEDAAESDVARKLKTVARICGQESRGFQMYGIFISQDAAGLSWLRKRALMVLAHQVMMWSERILVCNQNTEVARDMDTWPRGRTLAYGLAFTEGPIIVQQPRFTPRRIVEADPVPVPGNISFFQGTDAQKKASPGYRITPIEPLPDLPVQGTAQVPTGEEKEFSTAQQSDFERRYKACGSIKQCLSEMHLSYGRYQRCASHLVDERKLRRA